jgi:hypothetical protein
MVEVDIVIDIILCGYMLFLDIIDTAWVYVSVPERGNFLFVYRSAPYMNGSPNVYGAVPIYVWAHPFTFSSFFGM